MYIFNKYEMTIWTIWLLVFGIKIIDILFLQITGTCIQWLVSKIRCPSVTYTSIVCFCFLSLRSRKMWSNIVTMFCSFTAFSYYILFCSWPQKGVRGNRWNNCWRRPRAAGVTRYVTYLPISAWAVVMWFTYLYPFKDQVNYLYLCRDQVNYFPIDVQWRGKILST